MVTALAALATTGTNLAAGVLPAGPDAMLIGLCAEVDQRPVLEAVRLASILPYELKGQA